MTQKFFGVVGHPISHSQSPALHSAAYTVLGLDWSYEAFDVSQGALTDFIEAVQPALSGLSVTMPHKSSAFEFAQAHDKFAQLTGSVNTLYAPGSVLAFSKDSSTVWGYNTDVWGIINAFGDAGVTHAQSMSLIGSGSTAKSAVVAAHHMGVRHLSVIARNAGAIEQVLDLSDELKLETKVFAFENIIDAPPAELVVSTLPGSVMQSLSALRHNTDSVFLDVAYDPWPSARAAEWVTSGALAISGLSMLAHQALMQVRIFVNGSLDEPIERELEVKRAMFQAVGLGTH